MKRILFIAALAGIIWSCGGSSGATAEKTALTGVEIYKKQCAICHGNNGRKGLAGAKMIPESKLDLQERIALITNGKGSMMPYKDILSKDEIARVAEYTLTLE
ncbi:MAG: cytochrome c [Cryomorphaceae bacterium]|nr:cytochrome c [Flavobacteriales bacterium]